MLFVCVGNGGKSQMAAALMRQLADLRVEVHSAGTKPKGQLNALSVVTLGAEAAVEPVPRPVFETWVTDEPSEPGIERMRLLRDDLAARVTDLARLGVNP